MAKFNIRKNLLSRLKKGLPIYGEKENKTFGRLNKKEVAKLLLKEGVFDLQDIKHIPAYAKDALKEYTKDVYKATKKRVAGIPSMQSFEVPLPTGLARDDFESLMYYENINQEAEIEEERMKEAVSGDNEIAKDEDKWTLIRRLAKIDNDLNINRSYASDTLHELERMIAQGKRKEDIYEAMAKRLEDIKTENKKREDTLTSFFQLDQGFHGEEKTKARLRAEEKRHAKEMEK